MGSTGQARGLRAGATIAVALPPTQAVPGGAGRRATPLLPIHAQTGIPPHGHYSHAVRCGPLLFVSGVLGNNEMPAEGTEPTIEEQTISCLLQLEAIVMAAGGDRGSIARVGVYVADLALWPDVNKFYRAFFGQHRPARTIVPCGSLRFQSVIEMDAIAFLDE